ncbi:MAG TPA: helix-turn-helix domain-containing protein, partial [Candidatus Limnocylindrales bacterium]|nr:helix-turn-helix domain-containing protein [Candidatus Limnocylindrales bacterium]
ETAGRAGDPSRVVLAERLPVLRLLAAIGELPEGPALARALLAPILDAAPRTARARLDTLRAVLDASGPAEAAQALGVHRNTIAYRVRAIERLTGWDLRDPDLRLAVRVALRLVQLAQETAT